MSVITITKNERVREVQNRKITTEDLIVELKNWYKIDIDYVLKLLAKTKYGKDTERELTNTEKEIFCLTCSIYSDLEKSFIREYRRRIDEEELKAYIEILSDLKINLNNRVSATQYRNRLRQEIRKTTNQELNKELNTKLKIAIASVKVFDDRASWSRLRVLVNTILNLDSDASITPRLLVTLLSYKYPLI